MGVHIQEESSCEVTVTSEAEADSEDVEVLLSHLMLYQVENERKQLRLRRVFRGWPHGRVVKFMHSASAAQGFSGSDPGLEHGTARQATLRQCPTGHK